MADNAEDSKLLEAAVHELAQQLQVIEMAIASIERRDGERHAKVLGAARRALEKLDRGLDELAARVRGQRR